MITILKYNKITIDHVIYINFFSDGTVSYLTVYTNDALNTATNNTSSCRGINGKNDKNIDAASYRRGNYKDDNNNDVDEL